MPRSRAPAALALVAALPAVATLGCRRDAAASPPVAPRVGSSAPAAATAANAARECALLIVTLDTTRRDVLGFASAGGAAAPFAARTPVLDELAKRSVDFTRAWTVAPLTLPAHASLFTGLYPDAHGVRDNLGFRLPQTARTLAERFAAHGWRTGAVVAAPVVGPESGITQGFELFDGPTREAGIEERPAGAVTRAAVLMAARLASGAAPFLLWVHYFDAHAPHGKVRGEERAAYRDEVERIDRQLAPLLAATRAAAGARPLAVVVVADHGEALGDHGEATHGHSLQEATLRVPLLIELQGAVPGRCARTVSVVDLLPTLLESCGLPVDEPLQGRSLLPFLQDPGQRDARDERDERCVRFETRLPFHEFGWAWLDGACDGRFKWVDRPKPQLFDLDADPGETRDCAADHRERVEALSATVRELERSGSAVAGGPGAAADAAVDRAVTSLGYVAARRDPPADKSALAEPADRSALVDLRDRGLEAIGRGDFAAAVAAFEELKEKNPDPAPGTMLIAVARSRGAERLPDGAARQEALALAAGAWRAAVESCPGDALRRFNLAMTLLDLGRREEAVAELEQCVALAPEDGVARRELERARAK
jgi:choline-sulfatase